jgi:hypothetical protein
MTLVVSLLLYAAVLVASLRWLHAGVAEPWKYLVALMPVFPAMGIPYAVVRALHTMDELELRMQLEALAFGFGAAAIVTFTYGFLQNADLPQVSWVWVWPVMAVCWLVGQVVARRKYR